MHLRRWQIQMRIEEPTYPLGFYFWTNQYYYDLDNPPTAPNSNSRLQSAYRFLGTDVVQQDAVRVFDPADSQNIVQWFERDHLPCVFPSEGGYSPFSCMFVRWLVGERQVGYTRLRMPVPAAYQQDGMVDTELWEWVNSVYESHMIDAKLCDREGVPIERFEVSRRVHDWQYRHGTRRRERRVFEYPP